MYRYLKFQVIIKLRGDSVKWEKIVSSTMNSSLKKTALLMRCPGI